MRNIRSRIAKLEQSASATADMLLSASARKAVCDLLGRRDALFFPWRCDRDKHPAWMAEILRRQRAYRSGEEGSVLKAAGKTSWKLACEIRAELVETGMAKPISSGGQITSLLLTPKGESIAHGLLGFLVSYQDSRPVVDQIRELQAERSPVSEDRLWGVELSGNSSGWIGWMEPLLPGIVCGKVKAQSDTAGRLYFKIDEEVADPIVIDAKVDSDATMTDIYWTAYSSESNAIAAMDTTGSHEIFIPLPAGL